MKLSNFKGALGNLITSPTAELVISDQLKIQVRQLTASSRDFLKVQGDFARANPEHMVVKDHVAFRDDLFNSKATDDVVSYAARVLVADWELIGDDGKSYKYTPKLAMQLFNQPHGIGAAILSNVIETSLNAEAYRREWESVVTKN